MRATTTPRNRSKLLKMIGLRMLFRLARRLDVTFRLRPRSLQEISPHTIPADERAENDPRTADTGANHGGRLRARARTRGRPDEPRRGDRTRRRQQEPALPLFRRSRCAVARSDHL